MNLDTKSGYFLMNIPNIFAWEKYTLGAHKIYSLEEGGDFF